MKYPFILFFRDNKYNYIDDILKTNSHQLQFSANIINKRQHLNRLYKQIYSLLVIFGDKDDYKDIIDELTKNNMLPRVLFINKIDSVEQFVIHINETVNTGLITMCSFDRTFVRPVFSIFTSAYNSFNKIIRAFNSLQKQTLENWEWVIIDDSPDDKNFHFLRDKLTKDCRIRIYRRFENNGYIGNVKNEAISLCRGQYVLELDHDDEILPFVLEESAKLFNSNHDIGFIYMDFANVYENGNNFWYGNHICKGYGSYYCQKYNEKWIYTYITPNINNITLSHLVCCPNHPRIWRKDVLLKMGNFCEYLSICDDYEIILRTALNTKIAKIHKMGYIQYMNEHNNNFSLIRNEDINRIGPNYIYPIYYNKFDIHTKMSQINAYEDEKYLTNYTNIWERNPNTYKHQYCNLIVNTEYNKQYCIIGLDGLLKNIPYIQEQYIDRQNDFIIIDNKCTIEYLWKILDILGFDRMKCYVLMDNTEEQIIRYFHLCYLSTDTYEILSSNISTLKYNTALKERYNVINALTKPSHRYLEIGIEYGHTLTNTHFLQKVGVDPDPKCNNTECSKIFKGTSDEYFAVANIQMESFDVIFIDGMHHWENVLNDFNNSIRHLTKGGLIFIDDCIPINYNEQLKIPIKYHYDNNILKYDIEWCGDVWKFVYYLLNNYRTKIEYAYFHSIHYRGVLMVKILEPFYVKIDDNISLDIMYDYFYDFHNYLQLLENQINNNNNNTNLLLLLVLLYLFGYNYLS